MNYKAYHYEIIGNVVAYIAKKFYEAKLYYIPQMIMYKILAFFDYKCVTELGSPCTELDYHARKLGPVPEELYNMPEFESSFKEFKIEKVQMNDGKIKKTYICNCEPDMDYLSIKEQEILDSIIKRFIVENINAKQASNISHKEIKAWEKTRIRCPDSSMLYTDEFDRNIFTVNESELTVPELRMKLYSEFANA